MFIKYTEKIFTCLQLVSTYFSRKFHVSKKCWCFWHKQMKGQLKAVLNNKIMLLTVNQVNKHPPRTN